MNTPANTARADQLLEEAFEKACKDEDRKYLVEFLYQHAFNWAMKQYCMSVENADSYAGWFLDTFGGDWMEHFVAPPHSGWTIFKYARSLAHEGT